EAQEQSRQRLGRPVHRAGDRRGTGGRKRDVDVPPVVAITQVDRDRFGRGAGRWMIRNRIDERALGRRGRRRVVAEDVTETAGHVHRRTRCCRALMALPVAAVGSTPAGTELWTDGTCTKYRPPRSPAIR